MDTSLLRAVPSTPKPLPSSENVITRTIAVTSGKGGVGKSTISVNMAISLAKMDMKVLLIDGDLGLANINVLMGIIPEYNIYDVIQGKKDLSEIIISTNFGIDIIAGANGISQLADITRKQRQSFLKQMEDCTGYDVVLVDTGAGVGANVMGLVLATDEVLVVTTPEPTAVTDAYGMIKSIVAHNPQTSIRLIVNRVLSALEAKRVADRLKSISSQFLNASVESLGFVFEETLVQKSIRSQKPHVTLFPNSKSAACIRHIGTKVGSNSKLIQGDGLRGFFHKLTGGNTDEPLGILT